MLVAVLLLMSGMESNPGPAIRIGALNAQSTVRKGALIQDIITSTKLDVLAITESWIVNDDPDAIKRDAAPAGYDIQHVPRPGSTSKNRGGGLCLINRRDSITVKAHPLQTSSHYRTFECQLLTLSVGNTRSTDCVTIVVIYRPPSTTLTVFYMHSLHQFVTSLTRQSTSTSTGNLLDLVVGRVGSTRISQLAVRSIHGVSDHRLIVWLLSTRSLPPRKLVTFYHRNVKAVDVERFQNDIRRSILFTAPANTAEDFISQMYATIGDILNVHCPLRKRTKFAACLLYTSPSPRDGLLSRMPSSA